MTKDEIIIKKILGQFKQLSSLGQDSNTPMMAYKACVSLLCKHLLVAHPLNYWLSLLAPPSTGLQEN